MDDFKIKYKLYLKRVKFNEEKKYRNIIAV